MTKNLEATEPPETRPTPAPARQSFAGVMVTLAVGMMAWCVVLLSLDLVGRRFEQLRILADHRFGGILAFVLALGVSSLMSRLSRKARSLWWILFPLAVLPVGSVGLLLGELILQMSYGSVTTECEWPGLTVDECRGRDWSFMQDRLGFVSMRGRVDREPCRAFQAQVPAVPESPRTRNGWVRCPPENSSVWARSSCDALGDPRMHDCYVCSGTSDTNDEYSYTQSFDEKCERARVTYSVNLRPREIPRCWNAAMDSECLRHSAP